MDANLAFTFGLFAGIIAAFLALAGFATFARRARATSERHADDRVRAALKLQLRAIEASERGAAALAELVGAMREETAQAYRPTQNELPTPG